MARNSRFLNGDFSLAGKIRKIVDRLSKWTYCHKDPQGFFGFDFNQVPKKNRKKSPVLVIEKQCTKYLILLYFSHLFGNLNHDTSHPGDCYGGCKKFCTTKRMAETLPIMGCLPPIHWCRISSIHCINSFLLHPNGCVWKSGSLSFPFEGCCSGLSLIFGHSHIQLLFILMCIYICMCVNVCVCARVCVAPFAFLISHTKLGWISPCRRTILIPIWLLVFRDSKHHT